MRRFVLAAVLVALVFVPAAAAWTWPAPGDVVQAYSFDPARPYASGQHRGIDVAGDAGSPVRAPASGAVTFAGSVPGSGRAVTITTPDGYAVTLTHLGSVVVTEGAAIVEGDVLGTIGPSGDAEVDVPYVHLGIRRAADDQGYLDPLGFLPARGAPAPAPVPVAPPPTPAPAPPPAPEVVAPPAAPPTAAVAAPDPAPAATSGAVPAVAPAPAAAVPPATPRTVPAVAAPATRASIPRRVAPAPVARPLPAAPAPSARPVPKSRSVVRPATAAQPANVATPVAAPTPRVAARPPYVAVAPAVPAHRPSERGHRPSTGTAPHPRAVRPASHAPVAADARRLPPPIVAPVRHRPAHANTDTAGHRFPVLLAGAAATALACLVAALALVRALREAPRPLRMIAADVDTAEEGLGRPGVAVRLGAPSPWPRGGVRGPLGRVRALPPAQGARRAHGEWDGRARYAGHGRRRWRGEVLR